MLKNQLYPYIESYLKDYLHGFTKEQLDIGIRDGQIKFENLNLRPDGVNQKMDEKNIPFWIKAGLISKITIGCSIMNFIGEKPLDVLIEGFDIILNPSYKWIIKNIDSFIIENKIMMKSVYDPNDNNSMDIFTKKINVLDNSIFKKEYIEEIFKDKTKISNELNKMIKFCTKFYYQKNFLINLTIKNIHIRFEDDQLINYLGDLALGMKIDSLELILSSEGIMKKDFLKINKLCLYWEDPAEILIPSSLLNISIKDGKLDESYYTNVQKIKFQKFKYSKNNKFIVQNFSFSVKFGTKFIHNKSKIDFFNKENNNNYKFYTQFISNDLNFNFFPELMKINQNFSKFVSEFSVLEQVQDFKPMKKPYNIKSQTFLEFMEFINKNKNPKYNKNFTRKKKMLVRDWLFYFYWCQKCKLSLIGKKINPLRLEFSRFYNLCFNYQNDFFNNNLNILDSKENNSNNINNNINTNIPLVDIPKNSENKVGIEDYNPDKINMSYISDINIKSININLHPCHKNPNIDYICIKINNIEIKLSLLKTKFDFLFCCNSISLAPSKLSEAEKVYISSFRKKRESLNTNNNINIHQNNNYLYEDNYSQIINNIEENTGLTGLVNKYNPNYKLKLKIIDEALEKIGNNYNNKNKPKKKNSIGDLDSTNKNPSVNININNINNNDNISVYNTNNDNGNNNINLNDSKYDINNYNIIINLNGTNKGKKHYFMKRNTSFARTILSNYEGSPQLQKLELKRQKNNYSISQAILDYNTKKARLRDSEYYTTSNHNSSSNIFNTSNYSTYNANTKIKSIKNSKININNNNIISSNTKLPRGKPPLPGVVSPRQKNKTSRTQLISTGENIKINIFDIISNNNEKAFLFKMEKYNDEKNPDSFDVKLGNIRFNLYSNYISTCLNIFSDYKDILKQPLIKSIKNLENSILIQKELLNMKKYIYKYISNLPEEKKPIQIKEYFKFLEKEIELGIKMGIDSDIYEINSLFNFFPKGIEVSFDYEVFELIYYNSKKNNKISGKALLPSPELYFKLDFDKFDIKIFDFEIELEDLDDMKHILLQIWKIIQDKINITKLFIEPCLTEIRSNLEQKQRDSAKIKSKKKNKFELIEKLKDIKNKNNSTNNINNINDINNKNKNLTYTNEAKNTKIKNISELVINKKEENNEDIKPSNSFDGDEKEIKKIKINKMKNILNDLDEEKSQSNDLNNKEENKEENNSEKNVKKEN